MSKPDEPEYQPPPKAVFYEEPVQEGGGDTAASGSEKRKSTVVSNKDKRKSRYSNPNRKSVKDPDLDGIHIDGEDFVIGNRSLTQSILPFFFF
jgi:hypothetical protein